MIKKYYEETVIPSIVFACVIGVSNYIMEGSVGRVIGSFFFFLTTITIVDYFTKKS